MAKQPMPRMSQTEEPNTVQTLSVAIADLWKLPVAQTNVYGKWQRKYKDDPAAFAIDCFDWEKGEHLAQYQADIFEMLVMNRRVCVRSLHGAGKSGAAAMLILWFALTRDGEDWKIVTTASAWRQLIRYLWPEVHKWAKKLKWDMIGRPPFEEGVELQKLSLKLRTGQAFAVASNDPELIEGAHASKLLYIFDEAKIIPDPTWDSAEGAFASKGEVFWFVVSTPGAPIGRFYDIQTHKPGFEDWFTRHIKLQEAVESGRVDADWANQRLAQWGPNSARYKNRVKGEFAQEDTNAMIPLDWVERAVERWKALQESNEMPDLITLISVDVARSGSNKTVIGLRGDTVLVSIEKYEKDDTMETAGRVVNYLYKYPHAKAIVDIVGLGVGSFDRIREQYPLRVEGFIASASSTYDPSSGSQSDNGEATIRFANARAAAWWNLRELLDPANARGIAIPDDDELIGDLTAPTYRVGSNGRILVEAKDAIAKRIGRSTDTGDVCVMAFWEQETEGGLDFA